MKSCDLAHILCKKVTHTVLSVHPDINDTRLMMKSLHKIIERFILY